MSQIGVDTMALMSTINQCFDLAMDARLTPNDQLEFLAAGKRLRGYLINLVTARFDSTAPELVAANKALTAVNKDLKAVAQSLANASKIVGDFASLISALDGLLKVATVIV